MRFNNFQQTVFWIVLFFASFGLIDAMAGTCTSISRTNNSANAVLTSTKYNADHNTAYSFLNAYDGGCITDGTLELAAADATDWAVVLNSGHLGCKVSFSSVSALSIGKCFLAIGGNFVRTTVATSVNMGCTGCSGEAVETLYYVYAKSDSDDSTLNLLLLTTAPNEDGYDASGNRVLGRFYNNTSSDIDKYSIDQWQVNEFHAQRTGRIEQGTLSITGTTTDPTKGTTSYDEYSWFRDGEYLVGSFRYGQTVAGTAGSGDYIFGVMPPGVIINTTKTGTFTSVLGSGAYDLNNIVGKAHMSGTAGATNPIEGSVSVYNSASVRIAGVSSGTDGFPSNGFFGLSTAKIQYMGIFRVPILGWKP